jgi:serine/threonine protein kinase
LACDIVLGDAMSGLRIGKFQVLSELGHGANSRILHIRRAADAKHYALKVVPIGGPDDLKFLEQAQHEFRIARMLEHPNLIRIYALEIQRDWLFRTRRVHLLIEYVNGRTLDTLKKLPMAHLLHVFARVAAGLAHMHRRRVCHADMKPNNVMLSRSGDVKVLDYGLAWIKGEDKNRLQGTPEYMAPEQVSHSLVNERTDIFNFGATMYRLTTWRLPPSCMSEQGSLPLDAKNWARLLKPVDQCNAEAPRELCDLIHRCLSFSAHQRPERMADVQETLELLAAKHASEPLEFDAISDIRP